MNRSSTASIYQVPCRPNGTIHSVKRIKRQAAAIREPRNIIELDPMAVTGVCWLALLLWLL